MKDGDTIILAGPANVYASIGADDKRIRSLGPQFGRSDQFRLGEICVRSFQDEEVQVVPILDRPGRFFLREDLPTISAFA